MRRIAQTSVLRRFFFLVLILLVAGCSLEKKSGFNRAMQNLTAHYNILFDANELLRLKQEAYALSFVDSYTDILSVYQDTTASSGTPDKDLEEVKAKGGKIINIKEQSHYLGNAYLVIGKADFLEGDYFNASEFFSYVIRSFPNDAKLTEEAAVWKARALIHLNQLPQAKLVADSAIQNITKKIPKQVRADAYATKLQYDIDVQNYEEGEQMALQAIHFSRDKHQRLRWTFIMAQLQELNKKPQDAYKNYSRIVNSNALFEMAFNASLNRIRITESQNGAKADRVQLLRNLLNNENNKEFQDQIYYQIAEIDYNNKQTDEAMKNYRLSVRHSLKNKNQKGLSYLRLADIFFNRGVDYVTAKKYYDSTLMNLSPTYPGYQVIRKKSDNLQVLADRFNIITREELLQSLAKLDEKTRATKIDSLVNAETLRQQSLQGVDNTAFINSPQSFMGGNSGTGSSFYFYNANTVSQGYNDFKRRWGNRKLEDNWRRSQHAAAEAANNSGQGVDPDATVDQATKSKNTTTAGDYRKQLTQNIPLTPDLLAKSNQRIYLAYFDIANYYRDILGDRKEAITAYELLINRFPDSPDKPALYYNLYRLYADDGYQARSDEYKNLLLKNYRETAFAQIIIDPAYSQKLSDADAELTSLYNNVYDAYSNKDYTKAITLIDQLQKRKPNNKWSAQLSYIRTISQGHLEKFDPFRADLQQIIAAYPNDKLIVPLVKQHIVYLDANKDKLIIRPFVLTDKDPNEEPFIPPVEENKAQVTYNAFAEQQQKAYKQAQDARQQAAKEAAKKDIKQPAANQQPVANQPAVINQPAKPVTAIQQAANQPVTNKAATDSAIANKPIKVAAPSIFSMRDSTNYYFVVNVANMTTNLASSRFGFGQFNRANFPAGAITHQLLSVGDNNRLIYIGRFYSLGAVKDYARSIVPLLPDIMKVPKNEYTFFIITGENLLRLKDKVTLDSYLDYYQNNY
ncbi:MAG: tetratricopeptide repeat protein [Bacteroidetes bacterium]|nr:tetratricopeptide repeat protein [Bacteroidota bacterium]